MERRISTATPGTQTGPGRPVPQSRTKSRGLRRLLMVIAVLAIAIGGLAAIFVRNSPGVAAPDTSLAGKYPFQVGEPGPGEAAPAIQLPSTAGDMFDLAALRGKTVLLYFQEGIMCQPCWDQITAIESEFDQFRALGIDQVVTITGDDLAALKRKAADEGLRMPVLADPGLGVSKTYTTNLYGMMGTSYNGHSFIVVGPDGQIRWRADYGGAPNYTMYVRVPNLLADMKVGLDGAGQAQ